MRRFILAILVVAWSFAALASPQSLIEHVQNRRAGQVARLLEGEDRGLDLNSAQAAQEGRSPLLIAALQGDAETMEVLIRFGARLDQGVVNALVDFVKIASRIRIAEVRSVFRLLEIHRPLNLRDAATNALRDIFLSKRQIGIWQNAVESAYWFLKLGADFNPGLQAFLENKNLWAREERELSWFFLQAGANPEVIDAIPAPYLEQLLGKRHELIHSFGERVNSIFRLSEIEGRLDGTILIDLAQEDKHDELAVLATSLPLSLVNRAADLGRNNAVWHAANAGAVRSLDELLSRGASIAIPGGNSLLPFEVVANRFYREFGNDPLFKNAEKDVEMIRMMLSTAEGDVLKARIKPEHISWLINKMQDLHLSRRWRNLAVELLWCFAQLDLVDSNRSGVPSSFVGYDRAIKQKLDADIGRCRDAVKVAPIGHQLVEICVQYAHIRPIFSIEQVKAIMPGS